MVFFEQGGDLHRLLILVEDDLLGARQHPGRHLLQLLPEEDLVDVPLPGQEDQTLTDAAQLVQVARPLVVQQVVSGSLRQVDVALVFFLPVVQIKLGPAEDIGPAAAQRQHLQTQDAERIVEVAAELPLLHTGDQVHGAGCNDPDVGRHRPGRAVVEEAAPDQAEQLVLGLRRQHFHMAEIKGAVLRHFGVAVHRGVLPDGVVAEQHIVQRFRQPCAAVDGHEGVVVHKAFVVDALGKDVLAAAGLAGQEDGRGEFADPLGQIQHAAGLRGLTDHILEAVPGHEAPLIQLPAHLAVHFDQALAFLKRQDGALDLAVHQNGGDVDHHRLVVDVQHEGVSLLPPDQGVVQHVLVQVGQDLGDRPAQQRVGGVFQQVVADPVHPADDSFPVHLHDAAEGVVQQGVDLGAVPLFQIDGVGHAGRHGQGVAQAFHAGRNELIGQFFPPGILADDIAADDGIASVGKGTHGGSGQLIVLLHHIQVQIDAEQPVELGSVAEHIGKPDQPDAGAGKPQLLLEFQYHTGQLLLGHADLHQRQLDAPLDGAGLHAARHDQIAPLLFQLAGPPDGLIGLDGFDRHQGDGGKFTGQGFCNGAHLLIRNQNCNLCHESISFLS